MSLDFDKFAKEGNQFLKELAFNLGYPADTDKAARVLKSVLHVLRDALPILESLMAQLPMFLKAVYVQEWKYLPKPQKMKTLNQVADKLFEADRITGWTDFTNSAVAIHHAKVVLMSLRKYISEGEMTDITLNLRGKLRTLFEEKAY